MLDENGKVVHKKIDKVPQKEFIKNFLQADQDKFKAAMDDIFEHDPRVYAKLYVEMTKLVVPKSPNVNINVGINKDFKELSLMASSIVEPKKLPNGADNIDFGSLSPDAFQELPMADTTEKETV